MTTCIWITRLSTHPDLENPQTLGLMDVLYILSNLLSCLVICTSDIYCTSVRPRKKDPPLWFFLRFIFPVQGFFKFKGQWMTHLYSLSKPGKMMCKLWFGAIKIKIDLMLIYVGPAPASQYTSSRLSSSAVSSASISKSVMLLNNNMIIFWSHF